ncbi:MAG: hypothetical protein WA854_03495 [Candidatus Binataceae bacterium]
MSRLKAVMAGIAAVLFLAPGLASAKNFCIGGFTNTSYILLGQGFTIPKKGTCKAWIGFVEEPETVSSGTGCTSTDGTELTLSITSGTETGAFVEVDAITLSLPSLTGSDEIQVSESSAVTSDLITGISGAVCGKATIPSVTTSSPPAPSIGVR